MDDIKIIIDNSVVEKYTEYYFSLYPKRRKPPIESPIHPSMNKWMIMPRPQMNDLKQRWKEFGLWILKENNLSNIKINRCSIKLAFYFNNKRKIDLDNRSPKFLFDAFVEGGLVLDDNYFHINPLTFIGNYDKNNPRMEIVLQDIEF